MRFSILYAILLASFIGATLIPLGSTCTHPEKENKASSQTITNQLILPKQTLTPSKINRSSNHTIPLTIIEVTPSNRAVVQQALAKTNEIWHECDVQFQIEEWIPLDSFWDIPYSPDWSLSETDPTISLPDTKVLSLIQAIRAFHPDETLVFYIQSTDPNTLGWSYFPHILQQHCPQAEQSASLDYTIFLSEKTFQKNGYLTLTHELAHLYFNKGDDYSASSDYILYPQKNPNRTTIPRSLCRQIRSR